MKNKKIYSILLVSIIGLFACKEKDLELTPTTQVSSNFYLSGGQATDAIIAAYDPMGWVWSSYNNGVWGASLKTWGNFSSDDVNVGGKDTHDQQGYQNAASYSVSALDQVNLIYMWRWYFTGIYRANLVLTNVKPDDKDRKAAIAQAHFLRAFYYFYLTRMFGGLPLVKDAPKFTDNFLRSSQDSTYIFIENELLNCINSGDMQSRKGFADPADGLATIGSAYALLGKVYMYHKKYNEAIDILSKIDSSGNYKLESGFWKIFKPSNRHGVESLFEINFSGMTGAGNEGNADIYLFGPRFSDDHSGRWGNTKSGDTIITGWAFNQPRKALVDAFWEQHDTIRLYQTVLFGDTLLAHTTPPKGRTYSWQNNKDGYWDAKHHPDPHFGTTYPTMQNNDIILRLADVYLLMAEAYVRLGQPGDALLYVNKVRKRAHLADLISVDLTAVKKERRLELALEGERYFDMVRWYNYDETTKTANPDPDGIDARTLVGCTGTSWIDDKARPGIKSNGLFPIPRVELDRSNHLLIQNPGY
jgi:starch-binding outer membrane protein, SusD/RagB family